MHPILQGFIIGFIIVLPGMSGGTVFVILGIYEKMIKDLAKLNIKPYLPMIGGVIAGIFASGSLFAIVFEAHRDVTVAFLLGCLLASIKSVLKDCPKMGKRHLLMMATGFIVGFVMVGEPISILTAGDKVDWWILMIGGALSSAAMVIPGVPGSSVLILMGIYDTMLFNIKELNFLPLIIFALGSLIGIVLLLKFLEQMYERYKGLVSYFFAGIIIGSCRGLLPHEFNIWVILLFAVGFSLVWWWSDRE
ncbi:DUF368 domain-containing protein [Alkaliphilus crotonatoxidans]